MYRNHKKSPGFFVLSIWLANEAFRVGRFRVAGFSSETGIGIDQRSAGKFLESRWVNRMILPVSVAADDDHIGLVVTYPPADLIA